MWPPLSVKGVHPAFAWTALALGAFLVFRLAMPPFPATAPIVATVAFMLAALFVYIARRRLFVRSLAFALVGAVAYLFAWNRGVPMLYAFSAMCFAIVLVSHVLPYWTLRRVAGRVITPHWIAQGDQAALALTVTNPSPVTMRMLEVELPVEGAVADSPPARTLLVHLPAGATRELAVRTPPLRRGRRFAGPLTVRTGFPLGLASAEDTVAGSGQHVWIYPRLFDVEFVPIAGEQFLDMGDAISPKSGGVEEFAGVREYRQGDSSRHVHWRATAKRGELVVKEFMRRAAATVTIAVDLRESASFGEGVETTVEYAISVAASVARHTLQQKHWVQLALCGARFEALGPWRGIASLEQVMRALALAPTAGDVPPGGWLTRIAAFAPPDSTVVLSYVDWQLGSLAGLAALHRKNVLLVPVAIDAQSFGADSLQSDLPSRARARRIRHGEDPARVFRQ